MASLHALKLAALFHDPPWKPWVVAKKLKNLEELLESKLLEKRGSFRDFIEKQVCRDKRRVSGDKAKAHEMQSAVLLASLYLKIEENGGNTELLNTIKEALQILTCEGGDRNKLNLADTLAASFDRLVISVFYDELESDRVKFINPFDPRKELSLDGAGPRSEDIVEYARELVENLSQLGGLNPQLFLHAATTIMESLWYKHFPGALPPADTRTPHHTVFDHNLATMSMTNWIQEKEGLKGLLVMIDLAGVQAWISESRRLVDLWSASWISSALAWASINKLVANLGPDIVLLPSMRLNPFYNSWLYHEVERRTRENNPGRKGAPGPVELIKSLHRLFALGDDHETSPWPSAALMPNRITLFLPYNQPEGSGCRTAEKIILESYSAAWGSIVEGVLELLRPMHEAASEIVDDTEGSRALDKKGFLRLFNKVYHELLDRMKRQGPEGLLEPPFPIRIACIEVNESLLEEYHDFLHKFVDNFVDEELLCDTLIKLSGNGIAARSLEDKVRMHVQSVAEQILKGGNTYILLYPFIFHYVLPKKMNDFSLRLSKQAGESYAHYALSIWRHYSRSGKELKETGMEGGGTPPICTVCGTAYALVSIDTDDVETVRSLHGKLEEKIQEREPHSTRAVTRLIRQGERLCPYCLTKRLLPDMLSNKSLSEKLAENILGTKARFPASAKPLEVGSVDFYTARIFPVVEELSKIAADLIIESSRDSPCEASDSRGDLKPLVFVEALKQIGPILPRNHPRTLEARRVFNEIVGEKTVRLYKDCFDVNSSINMESLWDELFTKSVSLVAESVINPVLARELEGPIQASLSNYDSEEIKRTLEALINNIREEYRKKVKLKTTGTYFTLLRADADNMGSGILQGKLQQFTEDIMLQSKQPAGPPSYHYARTVMEKAGVRVKGGRRSGQTFDLLDVELVYTMLVRAFKKTVGRKNGKEGGEAMEPATLAMPSYHFTISRALSATSLTDFQMIRKNGGEVIYTGGDDLLAIVPPLDENSGGNLKFPVLRACIETRNAFHGNVMGGGFIKVDIGDKENQTKLSIVVPALSSAGRSYSITLARYKTPLWSAVWRSHCYLELKDNVLIELLNEHGNFAFIKDLTLIGTEEGDVSVLTNRKLAKASWGVKTLEQQLGKEAGLVSLVEELLKLTGIHEEKSTFSKSLIYDMIGASEYIQGFAKRPEVVEKLVESVVIRNLSHKDESSKEKAREIAGVSRILSEYNVRFDSRQGFPECTSGQLDSMVGSLLMQLFRAVKIMQSGVR